MSVAARRQAALVFALLVSLAAPPARAGMPDGHAFERLPSRFSSRELSVGARGLGELCLSRTEMPDGTLCNPALLGTVKEPRLSARLFVGNGYAAMSTANQLLFEKLSRDFLKELFETRNVTSLELSAGLSYTSRHFSASFTPYRVQYLSEIHNPNYPVVAVHASMERSLEFSGGTSLAFAGAPELSAGTRLRLLTRRFVHDSFSLFEAVAEDPATLAPVKGQDAVLLDPAVRWRPPRAPWRLSATLGARNLGWTWPKDPLYSDPADLELGLSTEPPVRLGNLRLGVDLVELVRGETLLGRVRAGASYRLGILELMTGLNRMSVAVGMQLNVDSFQGGIVYELMRKDAEGGLSENRVATEFGVRL